MAKKNPKNKNKPFLSFLSFFLLIFSLSLIFFQISKKPKEVKAVAGQLNINAVSGGVQSFNQVGIGTTNPQEKLHIHGGTLAISGSGLDGSTYQRFVLYSDTTNGLYFDAPKDSAGNRLPIQFNWRGGGTPPLYISGGASYGNVGIGTTSPVAKLDVNGTARLRGGTGTSGLFVDSFGNVGIGTPTPDEKLTIYSASAAYMNVRDDTREVLLGVDSNGAILSAMSNNHLILRAGGNSEKMRITAGGNVGIGTTNPGATLHIVGSAGSLPAIASVMSSASTTLGSDYPGLHLVNTNTTTNNFAYISFADAVGGNSSSAIATQFTDHTNDYGDLLFITRSAGGFTEKMRITSAGNVGIGTTNPWSRLHVMGDTYLGDGGTYGYKLRWDDSGDMHWIGYDAGSWWMKFTAHPNEGFIFRNYQQEIMRITNGNVGIGTTSPQSKLSIGTSGNSSYAVYVNTGSIAGVYSYGSITGVYGYGSSTGVYGYSSSTGVYGESSNIGVYGYSSNIGVYSYGGTYDFYASNSSGKSYFAGKVGIGTTNPVQRLDVDGHIRINTNIYGNTRTNYFLSLQNDRNLCLYDNGSAVWCTNTNVSDIRLKKNIVDMEPVLDTLNKLRVIRFNYIDSADDGTHQQHIGMIAQEVEKYYPDMVYTAPNNQKLINYGKFSALLLQGLKDQQKEIKSLKHSLDDIFLNSSDDVIIVENNLGYSIKNKNDSFITRISAFAQLVVAKIQAGLIETKKLIVDGVDIVKKINELSAKVESQQKEIEALKEEIRKLKK
jgi:hypothetical protein